MLPIEQLKKKDPNLTDLPDDEIIKIRDLFYDLGTLIFDDWVRSKGSSNYPLGDLPKPQEPSKL